MPRGEKANKNKWGRHQRNLWWKNWQGYSQHSNQSDGNKKKNDRTWIETRKIKKKGKLPVKGHVTISGQISWTLVLLRARVYDGFPLSPECSLFKFYCSVNWIKIYIYTNVITFLTTYGQPRRLVFGTQPYSNPTWINVEDDLNIIENERRPQYFKNGKQPQYFF